MSTSVISEFYADGQEPVKTGDLIFLDGESGRVAGVLMPGTSEAEDHYCEDTGGLMIELDAGFLILYPFGHHHELLKRQG